MRAIGWLQRVIRLVLPLLRSHKLRAAHCVRYGAWSLFSGRLDRIRYRHLKAEADIAKRAAEKKAKADAKAEYYRLHPGEKLKALAARNLRKPKKQPTARGNGRARGRGRDRGRGRGQGGHLKKR